MNIAYKKNQMSTDRENGRGNKRARVTIGFRDPLLVTFALLLPVPLSLSVLILFLL
jgi:hypothetical protein